MNVIRKFWVLALAVVGMGSMSWGSDGLSHYSLSATFNVEQRALTCVERVTITNTFDTPQKRFYFLLDNADEKSDPYASSLSNAAVTGGDFRPSPIQVHAVTDVGGRLLTFGYASPNFATAPETYLKDHFCMYIDLPEAILPSQSATFSLSFTTYLPRHISVGGERFFYQDKAFLRFGWYPFEMYRAHGQWVRDQGVVAPHYMDQVLVHVPPHYDVITAGPFTTPVLSVSLIIAKSPLVVSKKTSSGIQVDVVFFKDDFEVRRRAKRYAEIATEVLSYYESRYGALPYKRVVVVNSPHPGIWGMANSGMVWLGDHAFETTYALAPHYFDPLHQYILAHELGHLWAGVGTAVDFYNTNYLSEGLTDYMATEYFESVRGRSQNLIPQADGFSNLVTDFLGGYPVGAGSFTLRDVSQYGYMALTRTPWDQPLTQLGRDRVLNMRTELDYDKGQGVFRMLDALVGKPGFQAALKQYFSGTGARVGTTARLKAAFSSVSTQNIDQFFSDWIDHVSQVDLFPSDLVSQVGSDGRFLTHFRVNKTGAGMVPVTADLIFEDHSHALYPVGVMTTSVTCNVRTNQRIVDVVVDPDSCLLETNKLNNRLSFPVDLAFSSGQLESRDPLHHYTVELNLLPLTGGLVRLMGTDSLTHQVYLGASPASDGGWYLDPGVTWFLPNLTRLSLNAHTSGLATSTTIDYSVPIFVTDKTRYLGRVDELKWSLDVYATQFSSSEALNFTFYKFSGLRGNAMYHFPNLSASSYSNYGAKLIYDGLADDDRYGMLELSKGFQDGADSSMSGGVTQYFQLFGPVFTAVSVRGGTSSGTNPFLKFQTGEINRLGIVDDAILDGYSAGSVDLLLPLVSGVKTDLFNLAYFRGFSLGVFYEGGTLWSKSSVFRGSFAGVELVSKSTTLADVPFSVGVGVGCPVAANFTDSRGSIVYFFVQSVSTVYTQNIIY